MCADNQASPPAARAPTSAREQVAVYRNSPEPLSVALGIRPSSSAPPVFTSRYRPFGDSVFQGFSFCVAARRLSKCFTVLKTAHFGKVLVKFSAGPIATPESRRISNCGHLLSRYVTFCHLWSSPMPLDNHRILFPVAFGGFWWLLVAAVSGLVRSSTGLKPGWSSQHRTDFGPILDRFFVPPVAAH